MASMLVDSQLLDKHKTQHIIGASDQQLYLAADVPSNKGELRVLKRTFCSAEELQVLFCVPFEVDSWCSTQCIDRTSSLAIYHLAEEHIYAFANGYFDSESTISVSVLRISLLTGEYTRFQLANLDGDSYGGRGWQVCSHCRSSKLRLTEKGSLIIHDTRIVGATDLPYIQPTQAIELTLDEEEKSFKMYCREWQYPGLTECPAEGLPMLPINNKCSLWACLTAQKLVLCRNQADGCALLVGTPDDDTLHLMENFHSYTLRVDPDQHNRLQLVVEPTDATLAPFLFFDFGFSLDDRLFNLTLIGKSIVPAPGEILDLSHSSSEVYMDQGVLYKFYKNTCFTSFLRLPTLVEISFVALQKACGQKDIANGAMSQGIGPGQLNDLLDICVQWF